MTGGTVMTPGTAEDVTSRVLENFIICRSTLNQTYTGLKKKKKKSPTQRKVLEINLPFKNSRGMSEHRNAHLSNGHDDNLPERFLEQQEFPLWLSRLRTDLCR